MSAPTPALTGWRLWLAGARPRTLGAAIAPVAVGTGAAVTVGDPVWWRVAFALLVALALQVGVNFANDYSDGVRGTDHARVGPLRLTASGLASPTAVKRAALVAFGVAAVAGLVLALAVNPWLIAIGAAAIAAAWLYTGGPRPYGYSGLGELSVLVFFGYVATVGTTYVAAGQLPASAWWGATGVGLLAAALLLANNVRDVASDAAAGKRTLAVRLGDRRARRLYAFAAFGGVAMAVPLAWTTPWSLLGLAALAVAAPLVRVVLTASDPGALIPALAGTGRLEMVWAALVTLGLVVGR